jgi:histidinol-phosphate aminotransferase
MAAAILPVARWYDPDRHDRKYYSTHQLTAAGAIRLNSNENAYGPSESARHAIVESLSEANRYPRHFIAELKKEIASREGLTTDHVILTAGSTELLGLAGLAFGVHGGDLLACAPTFDFLMVYAEQMGCHWERTPLDENHQYDLNALALKAHQKTRLIFVCNPNNPTGVEIPTAALKDFCQSHASTYPVYVDEAYIELSTDGRNSSMAGLIHDHPNLIVARTFSKVYGLAGLRIGYALAHPDIINSLSDLHTGRSITLSTASAAAAMASLKDKDFEDFSRKQIIAGRKMITDAFDIWNVGYMPPAANFVFFRNEKFTEDPVKAMAKENIFIRSYDTIPGWTRVSVGTLEEVQSFINAMKKYT